MSRHPSEATTEPGNVPRFLVAESETEDERQERRESAGKSSGETYAATLRQLCPGSIVDIVRPVEPNCPITSVDDLRCYDAVFLTGSPLHVYEDTPEVQRQLAFMRLVFATGVPSFGSCAGLQIAVAAAGGTVRPMPKRMEAGIARGITRRGGGEDHPLLAGRPEVWDAAAIHGDEVERLPADATLLAGNAATGVQAAEIRSGKGIFWGVQYHPELAVGEIAAALERQSGDLIEAGLARVPENVSDRVSLLNALHRSPDDPALRWQLGVNGQFAEEDARRLELNNFLKALRSLDRRETASNLYSAPANDQ